MERMQAHELMALMGFGVYCHVECWSPGGRLRWVEDVDCGVHLDGNGVVNEGLDDILNVAFGGSTQHTTWYVGLVDNASFTSFGSADTAGGITTDASGGNSWAELTAYDEGNRVTCTFDAASSQSIANGTTSADFTMNATDTVKGAFLITDNTKGGTSGVLFCTAAFGSTRNVESGDTLKVTFTVNGAAA